MKNSKIYRIMLVSICLALVAATALTSFGCKKKVKVDDASATFVPEDQIEKTVIGTGEKTFDFKVKYANTVYLFEIHTDKEKVGEALIENNLIEGEEGQYGLYVKKVMNVRADYELDGKYWAFYVNGELGMTGVDMTEIEIGAFYEFRME